MVSCPRPFLCASERQKERHRATGGERESLRPVERDGVFIFRIDDQREGRCFALESAERYVGEHGAAEPLAMESLIDGETTDERRRQDRIAREAFQYRRRQIVRRNACRHQRVVTGNRIRRCFHGDETPRHTSLHILRGLFTEIPVERCRVAGEGRTIMSAERTAISRTESSLLI
jgi:hypothetical protein